MPGRAVNPEMVELGRQVVACRAFSSHLVRCLVEFKRHMARQQAIDILAAAGATGLADIEGPNRGLE